MLYLTNHGIAFRQAQCTTSALLTLQPISICTPGFMTVKKIKNESEIPHSEHCEESHYFKSQ